MGDRHRSSLVAVVVTVVVFATGCARTESNIEPAISSDDSVVAQESDEISNEESSEVSNYLSFAVEFIDEVDAVSPSGDVIVGKSMNGQYCAWLLADLSEMWCRDDFVSGTNSLSFFSPDGSRILQYFVGNGLIILSDAMTGETVVVNPDVGHLATEGRPIFLDNDSIVFSKVSGDDIVLVATDVSGGVLQTSAPLPTRERTSPVDGSVRTVQTVFLGARPVLAGERLFLAAENSILEFEAGTLKMVGQHPAEHPVRDGPREDILRGTEGDHLQPIALVSPTKLLLDDQWFRSALRSINVDEIEANQTSMVLVLDLESGRIDPLLSSDGDILYEVRSDGSGIVFSWVDPEGRYEPLQSPSVTISRGSIGADADGIPVATKIWEDIETVVGFGSLVSSADLSAVALPAVTGGVLVLRDAPGAVRRGELDACDLLRHTDLDKAIPGLAPFIAKPREDSGWVVAETNSSQSISVCTYGNSNLRTGSLTLRAAGSPELANDCAADLGGEVQSTTVEGAELCFWARRFYRHTKWLSNEFYVELQVESPDFEPEVDALMRRIVQDVESGA